MNLEANTELEMSKIKLKNPDYFSRRKKLGRQELKI